MRMTLQVIRFNRHYFAAALLACAGAVALMFLVDHVLVRTLLGVGIGGAVYFMIASVIAAYCIYDASDLYKLTWWPERCLDQSPSDGILVHAGFDPASAPLRGKYPQMNLRIFDFYDAETTTETSIHLAHLENPSERIEQRIAANAWPASDASQDVVFVLTAAHELRKPDERAAFFCEARRVLKPDGTVIVIEQLRDWRNFACFGMAAFHFLSRSTWLDSFAAGGLKRIDEFALTPFLRVFVLQTSLQA